MLNLSVGEHLEGARNFYRFFGIAKSNEVLLIPTIEFLESDSATLEALVAAGQEIGAVVTVCAFRAQGGTHRDPPRPVEEAIFGSDLFLAMGIRQSNPITGHCRTVYRARFDYGAKQADLTGGGGVLATEWARFPPEIIVAVARKFLAAIQSGHSLKISDGKGTNLSVDYDPFLYSNYICGSVAACEYGHVIPGQRATFPLGVFSFLPGDEASGVVAFDAVRGKAGRLSLPVTLTIRHNRIANVEGDAEADGFRRILDGSENAGFLNRIAIGLNPKATLSRGLQHPRHGEAQRRAGVVDIGIGDRVGLVFSAGDSQTGLLLQPTVTIEGGAVIVEQGRLTLLDDPEIRTVAAKYGDPDELLRMEP